MGTRRKNNKKSKSCSFKDFLLLFSVCSEPMREELTQRLSKQPRPVRMCGKSVVDSLNHLNYGTLDDIRNAAAKDDGVVQCIKILTHLNESDILSEDVNVVYGFLNFITKELERINGLFNSIQQSYTPEEEAAGIRELNFGSFGILDWYARRMGIVNQNDVREVAWVRIYQCMKNDNTKYEFERRLQKQYEKKNSFRK